MPLLPAGRSIRGIKQWSSVCPIQSCIPLTRPNSKTVYFLDSYYKKLHGGNRLTHRQRGRKRHRVDSKLEVCMGMGKTGIPWVPWDSHGNGCKISHRMGMEIKCMGMGVKTWELSPATVNSLLFLHSNME